jgi:Cu+-exporting ATPase
MVIDPVCGIDFEELEAAASAEFEGSTYYFCSDVCRDEFEANPHRYAVMPTESASASGTV